MGRQAIKFSVETWAGGDTVNMYGPDDDPAWVANDPVVHAEKLRGTNLYISSGSGLPTSDDVQYYTQDGGGLISGFNLAVGAIIEGVTNLCSRNLKTKLDSLGIPATYQFLPVGTHRWSYWQDALHESWPMLAQGTGI
ncbi:hypothetical protein ACTWPB_11280 [Nocardia sp. IBHARD005]|uniref:hypothetical protein n=1 Tax=Nocardia sp. IBHARD005 TaxID=3457765 RepID=UPI00405A19F1